MMHMRQHIAWVHLGQLMSNIYWTLTSVPINCVSAQQQRATAWCSAANVGSVTLTADAGGKTHTCTCLFVSACC